MLVGPDMVEARHQSWSRTMSCDDDRKNGKMELVRGGQYGQRRNRAPRTYTQHEFTLDRDMHTLFTALQGADGTVPSRAVQDVREGRHTPWRTLARRFSEVIGAGGSVASCFAITYRLNQYIAAKAAARTQNGDKLVA